MAAIFQDTAATLQLIAVAGTKPAAGDFIEIRYRAGSTGPMRQLFHPVDRLAGAVELSHGLARRGDVYIGAAPRTHRHGGAEAIRQVWVLWADLDTPDALERLERFKPAPNLMIRSGSRDNAHAWWALREPLEPAAAETANRRLAAHLQADPRSCDVARILRIAGSLHHKHDPPRPVECVACTAEGPLPLAADVLSDVPNLPDGTAPPRAARAIRGRDALLEIPAVEYVPALLGRPLSRDGKTTCPFHGDGEERTPSLHAYEDDGGWYCFGCERGGTIVDLGALLYRIEPRGRGYHDVRRRLAGDLLGSESAAA